MTINDREFKFDFYYTEDEYLAASRLYFLRSSTILIRLILLLSLIAGLFLMLPLVYALDFPLWAILSLTALTVMALLYNVFINVPRRYFRGDPKFRDKYEMTFSDEGIWVKTKQIDSKLAWSLYTKVIEGDNLFLLIYGQDTRTMTVIPKRVFQSKGQETAFRKMLKMHIADHLSLGQISKTSDAESEYTPSSLNPPDWR